MLGLWFIFAGMILFALALLLRPLLQGQGQAAQPAGAHDIEVYRDQLAELDRDRERGLIGDEEAASAKTEIERRILAAGKEADGAEAAPVRPLPRIALAVSVLIPLAAGAMYFSLGHPEGPAGATRQANEGEPGTMDPAQRAQMVQGMVARLEARLQANPDDAQGWRLLGRSYFVLGRQEDSIRAYGRAATLAPEDRQILSDYAMAMILSTPEQERPPERALPVLRRLLTLQPENPLAHYFLGIAAARDGEAETAREHFERVLAQLPENSPLRREIESRLSALDE